jgi:hypothetical protein
VVLTERAVGPRRTRPGRWTPVLPAKTSKHAPHQDDPGGREDFPDRLASHAPAGFSRSLRKNTVLVDFPQYEVFGGGPRT